MKNYWLAAAFTVCLIIDHGPVSGTNIWMDILSCVRERGNDTTTANQNSSSSNETMTDKEPIKRDYSMAKLFSIICGDNEGFVQCMDTTLKKSNDSTTQIIGYFFDPALVAQAYKGLCTNITELEQEGVDVISCLSTAKVMSCQNEMADYFFYMGVVKQFAPASEQLSRNTMETLLCRLQKFMNLGTSNTAVSEDSSKSLLTSSAYKLPSDVDATSQRRSCEVQALRKCNENLAKVMQSFYTQTQPASCAELEQTDERDSDNKIE